MSEYDLVKYKQSKVIVNDLEVARILLKGSYKQISAYKKYIPIKNVLYSILEAECQLKSFLTIHKQIVKDKGQIK